MVSPSTMPAISAPNSRAMSSVRTSESSTTSCSSAAAIVVLSSSCSARIEGHRDAVGDEILARHPLLAPVRGRAEAERPVDQLEIEPIGVTLEHRPEIGREVRQGSGHSRPAVAKLTKRSPAMITWS